MAKRTPPAPPPGDEPELGADMIGLIRQIRETRSRANRAADVSYPPWTLEQLKESLRDAGVRPSRKLGQNFLIDPQLLDAIVRDAEISPGDHVLEIGPGAGSLTAPLLAAGARVLAVEIDERLVGVLDRRFDAAPRLKIIVGDVLQKSRISDAVVQELPAAFKVVANLPYSAGTTFLMDLIIRAELPWTRAVCTVQREVADRFASAPGSRVYGLTSVIAQTFCETRVIRKVPREVFWPRPNVVSAVLELRPRPDPPLRDEQRQPFCDFCKALFTQRRKKLVNSLASASGSTAQSAAERIAAVGLDGGARVEALSAEQLQALFCHE